MKYLASFVFLLAGFAAAAYLGIWIMLVGGIMQIVSGVTVDPVSGPDIAWGIVRVFFCGAGWLAALPFWGASAVILKS